MRVMERTSEALVYCPESAEKRRSHLWRSCTEAVIGLLLLGVMAVGNIRGPDHKFVSSASDLFWPGFLFLWVLGVYALNSGESTLSPHARFTGDIR